MSDQPPIPPTSIRPVAGSSGPGVDPLLPCVEIRWDGDPIGLQLWGGPGDDYADPVTVWRRKTDPVLGVYYEAIPSGDVLIFYADGSVGRYVGGSQVKAGTWGPCH